MERCRARPVHPCRAPSSAFAVRVSVSGTRVVHSAHASNNRAHDTSLLDERMSLSCAGVGPKGKLSVRLSRHVDIIYGCPLFWLSSVFTHSDSENVLCYSNRGTTSSL